MEDKLLTIPEFAKLAGIAKQGIYEQVKKSNSKLFPYVVYKGKKVYIKFEALEKEYNKTIIPGQESQDSQGTNQDNRQAEQGENQGGQGENQAEDNTENQGGQGKSQADNNENISATQQLIDLLREQLQEKDKQIERLHILLAQEKQAHQNTIKLLEEKSIIDNGDNDLGEQDEIVIPDQQEQQTEQEKLTFWQRFINWWNT